MMFGCGESSSVFTKETVGVDGEGEGSTGSCGEVIDLAVWWSKDSSHS